MQAIEHDGARRFPELYEEEGMKQLLGDDEVKEVRVFNLRKGMEVTVEGGLYKVTACRPNGKITLRRKKNA